jgi:hypothetical protein
MVYGLMVMVMVSWFGGHDMGDLIWRITAHVLWSLYHNYGHGWRQYGTPRRFTWSYYGNASMVIGGHISEHGYGFTAIGHGRQVYGCAISAPYYATYWRGSRPYSAGLTHINILFQEYGRDLPVNNGGHIVWFMVAPGGHDHDYDHGPRSIYLWLG